MKAKKRLARRLPLPDGPTLTLRLDSGREIVLDRLNDDRVSGAIPGVSPRAIFIGEGFAVVVSRSLHPEFGQLLHASITHDSGELVEWYVLKALKTALFPANVGAILPLPEEAAYTNITEALHIIQMPSEWGSL